MVPAMRRHTPRGHRRGVALVEVLVAFPLIALLSTVAVVLLLTTVRGAREQVGHGGATRERHAASLTLRTELQRLRPDEVITWRDTLLEVETLVGLAMICAVDGTRSSVTVVASDPPGNAGTVDNPVAATWHEPPQPGDLLTRWVMPLTDAGPSARPIAAMSRIQSVATGNGCATSPLPNSMPAVRLELAPAADAPRVAAVGTPVRLTRRIRYSLYRATDGLWYLGRRTFGPTGWDIVQPVAGPFASPSEGGMRVTVLDWRNGVIAQPRSASGDSVAPAAMQITLRAPRRTATTAAISGVTDAARITVAFRSRPTLEPR